MSDLEPRSILRCRRDTAARMLGRWHEITASNVSIRSALSSGGHLLRQAEFLLPRRRPVLLLAWGRRRCDVAVEGLRRRTEAPGIFRVAADIFPAPSQLMVHGIGADARGAGGKPGAPPHLLTQRAGPMSRDCPPIAAFAGLSKSGQFNSDLSDLGPRLGPAICTGAEGKK